MYINYKYAKEHYDFCVLHELCHTLQIDKGYPSIYYDDEQISCSEEKIIGLLDSLVKDIYVNRYLQKQEFELIRSPNIRFRDTFLRLNNKGEKDNNDKTMMVICLISLKYAYMQDVQDLLRGIGDYGIAKTYENISSIIKENDTESYISLKNIYEQFAKEFTHLKIVYIK